MNKRICFLAIILVGLLAFSSCVSMSTQIRKKAGIDFSQESITKEEILKLENPEFFQLWLEWKPIKLSMTKEEKKLAKEILDILDKAGRDYYIEKFIEFFWKRRDTNSYDDENREKDNFYNRVVEAQERYGNKEDAKNRRRCTSGRGWQTDMGLIYIVLGEPFTKDQCDPRYLMNLFRIPYQESAFIPQKLEVWYYELPEEEYEGTLFQGGMAWILFEQSFGFWRFAEASFDLFYNYQNYDYRRPYMSSTSNTHSYYIGEVYRFIEAVAKYNIYDKDLEFEDMFIKWVPVKK